MQWSFVRRSYSLCPIENNDCGVIKSIMYYSFCILSDQVSLLKETIMSNKNAVGSNVLHSVLFTTLISLAGLASCSGGDGSSVISGGYSSISVSLIPSRTTGAAPLSVFFDATSTTAISTSTPFHELLYFWSFGDSTGSPVKGTTWDRGSQSAEAQCAYPYNSCRNNATGAVAAHVFENPGTFTVTLTVSDGSNTVTKTQDITVMAFSGTTYCIHNSTPLNSGVCNGHEQATTGNANTDIANGIAAGAKQILFKRGDSFNTGGTNSANITVAGPGIIGAYGSGAVPNITGTSSTAYNAIFNITGADWRIMDLNLTGSGANTQYAGFLQGQYTTVLRVISTDFVYSYDSTAKDSITIQDSTVNPGHDTGIGYYCGAYQGTTCSRIALMGNSIHLGSAVGGHHDIRLQGTHYFVINNSDLYGPNPTEVAAGATYNGFTVRGDSQYGEIADNNLIYFDSQIQPQNNLQAEYQRDVIVERNFFTSSQLIIHSSHITIRNNIFNMTGYDKTNGEHAVEIQWPYTLSPVPVDNHIYNNTMYTSDSSGGGSYYSLIRLESNTAGSGCTLTTGNNLAYIPNGTTQKLIFDESSGGCTITHLAGENGNSSDTQVKSVPPTWTNSSGTYSVPADFNPTCTTTYPCQQGVDVPVWIDFFGKFRATPYDMGAVNH